MQPVHQLPDDSEPSETKLTLEPLIHETAYVIHSRLGEYTEIQDNCQLNEVEMGDYSYMSTSVTANYCVIGNFVSIASHCVINPGNHPVERVTQHHATYRRKQYGFNPADDETLFNRRREQKVIIGHDVWLGHGAMVMPGATIENGAVIAAGAIVTRTQPVGPYEIAVGIPARPVKKRFSTDIINRLQEIRYWDWPREKLEKAFDDFYDINTFIQKY